ncbi:hypothetical protein [[Clostridium] colinum]|uniref:hypothetical protein n=1 Tax=[Clostridium] colinum TaxID=36835 RepID=UPI002025641F|nr:hypothetical protein [[Clostridium] colinum]
METIEFLTFREIIFCIILSFIILIFLKVFLFFKKLFGDYEYPIKVFSSMIKDFYIVFHKEAIAFRGNIYKRGMIIRVITSKKKVYEGEFVGFNGKDMICIITKNSIVTNHIKNIKDIILIKE